MPLWEPHLLSTTPRIYAEKICFWSVTNKNEQWELCLCYMSNAHVMPMEVGIYFKVKTQGRWKSISRFSILSVLCVSDFDDRTQIYTTHLCFVLIHCYCPGNLGTFKYETNRLHMRGSNSRKRMKTRIPLLKASSGFYFAPLQAKIFNLGWVLLGFFGGWGRGWCCKSWHNLKQFTWKKLQDNISTISH